MSEDGQVAKFRLAVDLTLQLTELSRRLKTALVSGDFPHAQQLFETRDIVYHKLTDCLSSITIPALSVASSISEINHVQKELRAALDKYVQVDTDLQHSVAELLQERAEALRLRNTLLGAIRGYKEGQTMTDPIRRIFSCAHSRYLNEQG